MTVAPSPEHGTDVDQGWRQRVLELVLAQLRQGITAEKIALTVAIGLMLGLFPIFGSTTALCVLVGLWLKLNQPIMQLANWLAWPLQIPGIYLFVRVGEWLTRSPPVHFSIAGLVQQFRASPLQFLQQFGMTGLRGVLGWLLIAPAVAAAVYVTLLPPLRRLARLRGAGAPRRAD
ncbi:MAG: DUF2062 domain-containing protein [Steroidobacterales bacterium]